MGSPLGPLLANVFMCSIEDRLDREGKMPYYYRRYVDDTLTFMPSNSAACEFLSVLNTCHHSIKFTIYNLIPLNQNFSHNNDFITTMTLRTIVIAYIFIYVNSFAYQITHL